MFHHHQVTPSASADSRLQPYKQDTMTETIDEPWAVSLWSLICKMSCKKLNLTLKIFSFSFWKHLDTLTLQKWWNDVLNMCSVIVHSTADYYTFWGSKKIKSFERPTCFRSVAAQAVRTMFVREMKFVSLWTYQCLDIITAMKAKGRGSLDGYCYSQRL